MIGAEHGEHIGRGRDAGIDRRIVDDRHRRHALARLLRHQRCALGIVGEPHHVRRQQLRGIGLDAELARRSRQSQRQCEQRRRRRLPRVAVPELCGDGIRHQRRQRLGRGVADHPPAGHRLRIAAVTRGMRDGADPAASIKCELSDDAAYQQPAAGVPDRAGERAGEALRAALHIAAAALQIAALRHREEYPPQGAGIVVKIGEVGGERAFYGFIVAEDPVELLR